MKNNTKLIYLSLACISLFCMSSFLQIFLVSPESTNNRELRLQTSQPYENDIADSWVRQDSANCGPTSLYMIFKYYNDHLKENIFYDDGDALSGSDDIRIDVTFLDINSEINDWLGYTYWDSIFGGIRRSDIDEKLRDLQYDGEYYYNVVSNLVQMDVDDYSDKTQQFDIIRDDFLNEGRPVIIHLDRASYSGHFIVMVGFDANDPATTTDDEVIFMDPYLNKYEYEGVSITNNIPNNPLIRVSLSDFMNEEWYNNGNGHLAYWDGIWYGFHSDSEPTPPDDTTPPSSVSGLTVSDISYNSIELYWDANSESDLDHYNVYRNGILISAIQSNSFIDDGLSSSTEYIYEVTAVDTSDNEGQASNSVSVTTAEEPAPPETPVMYVNSMEMDKSNRWSWFYIYIVGYRIYVDVEIVDGDGVPLSGAYVSMQLDIPGGSSVILSGTTDSNGCLSVNTAVSKISGTYVSTVISVSKDGYEYNPSINVVSQATLTI